MVNVPSLQRSDKHCDDGKCVTEHQERVNALSAEVANNMVKNKKQRMFTTPCDNKQDQFKINSMPIGEKAKHRIYNKIKKIYKPLPWYQC